MMQVLSIAYRERTQRNMRRYSPTLAIKSDVRFVYHLNLPSSLEAYYQEIGRAGRDGAEAETAMVYGLDDIRLRRQFISDDGSNADHQLREHKRLDALLGYCEAAQCRRQILMSYFGEDSDTCGNCDVCDNPPILIDATETAMALFEAIEQTGQRFASTHVISVARGEATDRVLQFNHDKLPAFGSADLPKPYFQGLLRQAVALQYLHVNMESYGRLELLPKAYAVMEKGESFMCKDPVIKKAATKKPKRQAQVKSVALDETDAALLTRLKVLRMNFARELGKPAFVVFSDATLMDMVMKRPQTKTGMMDVNGVGPSKYERFGEAFLAEISA